MTLFLFLPVCFQEHKAFGTLTPNHIVIVVNRNNPGSRSVAQHYATRRGVPQDHILPLDLPHNETISRPDYQELLVHPLQELLKARKLASKTRVLVTTYGVPLRVQGLSPSRKEAEWKKDAEAWQRAAQKSLEDLNLEINQVMDQPTQGENPLPHTEKKRLSGGTPDSPEPLLRTIAASVKSTQVRIRNIKVPHRRKEKEQRLSKVILKISGTSALAKVPFLALATPGLEEANISHPKSEAQTASNLITLLMEMPSTANRGLAYQLAQQAFGITGVLDLAMREAKTYTYKEADASVDSKLSLLWWDKGLYSIPGRMPNPFYAWHPVNGQAKNQESLTPIPLLMVSRIDAPTPELARQMVDFAILAEQVGLLGNAYKDARGLNAGDSSS
ncbi:MAG: TIGR03790 family protein [Nitrospirae bacterium]|nr:TIGR03790 family protein [Nitrospirota bacterium]